LFYGALHLEFSIVGISGNENGKRTSVLNLKVRRLIKSSWARVEPALNSGGALQSELHLITHDYGIRAL
jgi:hypothetical protein